MRIAAIFIVLAVVLMIVLATKERPAYPDEPAAAAATAPAESVPAIPPPIAQEEEKPWSPGGFDWLSPALEASPGFADPNRLDPRTPTGDPLLWRAMPQGPRIEPPEKDSYRW